MKITISWIKEYLDTSASDEQIIQQLNMLGLVIDDVIDRSKGLEAFKIVHIIKAEKHPEADKLQICTVNTGSETLQIVCGGVNARSDMKAVLAPIGSVIPTNGMKISMGSIRGVESQGMLCSAEELGLAEPGLTKGIIELENDAPIGQIYAEYAGLNDLILDVEITPNRGDCLGAYGLARDLAATGIGTLKPIVVPTPMQSYKNPINVVIRDESKDICTKFSAIYIKGVKNCPSPEWMQKRLLEVGLRPISALVDITNYLSQGIGRPMHVFDADKIEGDLIIRQAKKGETITALNDVKYELDETVTVVGDANTGHAIGGIIGGLESGCTESTKNVLIECAMFDAVQIALTGRKLNIITDARSRFERGVDIDMIPVAQKIATQFILDYCGGEASEMSVVGIPDKQMPIVPFRPSKVKDLIGIEVPKEECRKIIKNLGMECNENGDVWQVKSPTWRHDINLEADVIEEIIRIHGYDHIPTTRLNQDDSIEVFESFPGSKIRQKWGWQIRRALCSKGLNEALTLAFLDEKTAKLFGGGNPAVKLVNPISSELSDMRPSLLPNLINAVQRNFDHGLHNVNLFEVGKQFFGILPEEEKFVCAGVRSGKFTSRHWSSPARDVDIYDAKADAIIALQACGVDIDNLTIVAQGPDYFHPGRSGYLMLGPKNRLAAFGEIHPQILADLKIDPKIVGFEVYIENIPLPKKTKKSTLFMSPYQPVERDFAFIVDKNIAAQDVLGAIKRADKDLISDIKLFDVFEGNTIADGKKSVAITVRIEPKDGTLTDEQLTNLSAKIVDQVKTLTGGELRS